MSYNALLINPKIRKIEKIKLKNFDIETIKTNIRRFDIFPTVLEKIVIDYENYLTMVTEINSKKEKDGNGFYFKGFYISSKAIIAEASFPNEEPIIRFNRINDINYSENLLDSKIVFSKDAASQFQKLQIEVISNIRKTGVNPFDVISYFDIKYSLRANKIIDIIDELTFCEKENSKQILKDIAKNLKIVTSQDNQKQKYNECINILQKMFSLVYSE